MTRALERLDSSKRLSAIQKIAGIGRFFVALASLIIEAGGFLALGNFYHHLSDIWITILFAAGSTAVVISVYLVIISVLNIYRLRSYDWNRDIWIFDRSNSFLVTSKTEIAYKTKLKIKILRDGIDSLNLRNKWTGVGNMDFAVKNRNFQIVPLNIAGSDVKRIKILFDYARKKGDILEIEYTTAAHGSTHAQDPFYSATMYESRVPLRLEISGRFQPGAKVDSASKMVFCPPYSDGPLAPPEAFSLRADEEIRWEIEPKYDHRYCLTWEYGIV